MVLLQTRFSLSLDWNLHMLDFRSESAKLKDRENKLKIGPPLRNEFENKGIHTCDKRLGSGTLSNK